MDGGIYGKPRFRLPRSGERRLLDGSGPREARSTHALGPGPIPGVNRRVRTGLVGAKFDVRTRENAPITSRAFGRKIAHLLAKSASGAVHWTSTARPRPIRRVTARAAPTHARTPLGRPENEDIASTSTPRVTYSPNRPSPSPPGQTTGEDHRFREQAPDGRARAHRHDSTAAKSASRPSAERPDTTYSPIPPSSSPRGPGGPDGPKFGE